MANTHLIKTWTEYFEAVKNGTKTFELRKDDRNYQVGDLLCLMDYDSKKDVFSGERLWKEITYKLEGGNFGLEKGFCVLGIK